MSYSSYNNETPLDLNNVRNIEGLTDAAGMNNKLDEIKSTIADFENKKQLIISFTLKLKSCFPPTAINSILKYLHFSKYKKCCE